MAVSTVPSVSVERHCRVWRPARWICLITSLVYSGRSAEPDPSWPVCDSRAYRDEEVDPGGLKLLGVKESPLGDFPIAPTALTHEHFFQQLREIWSDDCPRIMVQLGLQPAAGRYQNWTAASLWLRYFNHSGRVLAVDAISDYLQHFEDGIRSGETAAIVEEGTGPVQLLATRGLLAAEGRPNAKARPVSFDAPGGRKVLAADEVMRACADGAVGPEAEDAYHPCALVRSRMAKPQPVEYVAPVVSFDELWRREDLLNGRHVDFLQIGLGVSGMVEMLKKGFGGILAAREVSVLSFRVDELWTKADLGNVVEYLDSHDYFSLFKFVCSSSSQSGTFSYVGPSGTKEGGAQTGPTTYLPISGINFEKVIDWDRMPLPQDVLVFDLRQPDLFKAVQIGDAQCDAEEAAEEDSCPAGAKDGECKAAGADSRPPDRPQQLRVFRSESRSLTLEWRPYPDGPKPETYALRVDPGAMEDSLEHNMFDVATGVQMHTIIGLKPGTEYTIKLQSVGPGGVSSAATVTYRTEREDTPATDSLFTITEGLHCGMSSSEEVLPPGPPPEGGSFFRDVTDAEGCRARCDDSRTCVAFQVKVGDACWLYRRRPREGRMNGPRTDVGWYCGFRNGDV